MLQTTAHLDYDINKSSSQSLVGKIVNREGQLLYPTLKRKKRICIYLKKRKRRGREAEEERG